MVHSNTGKAIVTIFAGKDITPKLKKVKCDSHTKNFNGIGSDELRVENTF